MAKNNTNRIGYIDAMRGLAMLMVVLGHVQLFSGISGASGLMNFSLLVELPLFFLVSGLLMYKADIFYMSWRNIVQILSRKFLVLIVPATLFLGVVIIYSAKNPIQALYNPYKEGYWFTFTLFYFCVVYVMLRAIGAILKVKGWIMDIVLICAGIALSFVATYFMKQRDPWNLAGVFGLIHIRYFIYFIVGTLITKNKDFFLKLFRSGYFAGVIILLCWFCCSYSYGGDGIRTMGPSATLYGIVIGIISLLFVYIIFYRIEYLSGENFVGRTLRMFGVYSLDIYFIHTFFLPQHISYVGEFFDANPSPCLEFMVYLIAALAISFCSIGVSKVIALSPQLSWLFLGKKNNKRIIVK